MQVLFSLFQSHLKPISSQTHPGCGHLTLKTSRKSLPFTVYLDLKQSENLGRPTPQKHGFPHFFYFFSCTPRVTFRQIGVCSSFSCRLSATVTKRHAKGGSQKTPKSTKSRFFVFTICSCRTKVHKDSSSSSIPVK